MRDDSNVILDRCTVDMTGRLGGFVSLSIMFVVCASILFVCQYCVLFVCHYCFCVHIVCVSILFVFVCHYCLCVHIVCVSVLSVCDCVNDCLCVNVGVIGAWEGMSVCVRVRAAHTTCGCGLLCGLL